MPLQTYSGTQPKPYDYYGQYGNEPHEIDNYKSQLLNDYTFDFPVHHKTVSNLISGSFLSIILYFIRLKHLQSKSYNIFGKLIFNLIIIFHYSYHIIENN